MSRNDLAAVLGLFVYIAVASDEPSSLMVIAEAGPHSAIWTAGSTRYVKRMEVTIGNPGPGTVQLSGGCVRGYDSQGNAFSSDTVQDTLLPVALASGATAKGFATFTASDPSAYDVASVRFVHGCD